MYSTAQRQLNAPAQSTHVLLHGSLWVHVRVWHTCLPKDNRDGNDAVSSPPSSVLHGGLFILHLLALIQQVEYVENAVTYNSCKTNR